VGKEELVDSVIVDANIYVIKCWILGGYVL
jgi:hypothetical protein